MNLEPNTIPYYNDKYTKKALHSGNPENRRRFERIYQLTTGKKILDIGCGEGYLVNMLAGHGFDSTGVDFSNIAIARAKRGEFSPAGKFNTVGKFVIAYITKTLPFSPCSFDNIVLGEVIEHFQDPDFLFKESIRLLRPSGRIILTVPAYPKAGFPEHVQEFTLDTLSTYLKKWGKIYVERTTERHFIATVDILEGEK